MKFICSERILFVKDTLSIVSFILISLLAKLVLSAKSLQCFNRQKVVINHALDSASCFFVKSINDERQKARDSKTRKTKTLDKKSLWNFIQRDVRRSLCLWWHSLINAQSKRDRHFRWEIIRVSWDSHLKKVSAFHVSSLFGIDYSLVFLFLDLQKETAAAKMYWRASHKMEMSISLNNHSYYETNLKEDKELHPSDRLHPSSPSSSLEWRRA